jgi:hypothetical protein
MTGTWKAPEEVREVGKGARSDENEIKREKKKKKKEKRSSREKKGLGCRKREGILKKDWNRMLKEAKRGAII